MAIGDFRYISHASTLEELRADILSDLKRRLDATDRLIAFEATKGGKAKLEAVKRELEDLARFWQAVELKARKRKSATP